MSHMTCSYWWHTESKQHLLTTFCSNLLLPVLQAKKSWVKVEAMPLAQEWVQQWNFMQPKTTHTHTHTHTHITSNNCIASIYNSCHQWVLPDPYLIFLLKLAILGLVLSFLLSLDHKQGPKYLIECLPKVTVLKQGVKKSLRVSFVMTAKNIL